MHSMLFGMETELAFAAWESANPSAVVDRVPLISELFSLASERLRCLPDEDESGFFLENGSRFYLDSGEHPELCTPECQSPIDVVRWELAGERILAELAVELEKRHPEVRVALFRCNVDYSGSGNTWGCHECYQNRSSQEGLIAHLIPHLVTRLVYTGAGGFNNLENHLEFLLSPRVPHLVRDIGSNGVGERGIYHDKNEPLCEGGFNRLHLVCGESTSSQLSTYLKLGTTALVVRLIDAGVCRGEQLAFRAPLQAMRAFARDPSCRARAPLADGRQLTATEVQAEYLAMVEQHLGADFMPEWAPALCRRWRWVLEQLESDPGSLAGTLDWVIKHTLYRERAKRAQVPWSEIRRGTEFAARMCEIDTHFGELGARGFFHALDRAGVLDHRLPELGSVEAAMTRPPPGGRAESRGKAIAELYEERSRYRCSWDAIRDEREDRRLDLSDPFVTSPRWRRLEVPAKPRSPRESLRRRVERTIDEGCRHYQDMHLERAISVLETAIREARRARDREKEARARFWCACAHQDAGNLDGAESVIRPAIANPDRLRSTATANRVWTRHALILLEHRGSIASVDEAIQNAREVSWIRDGEVGRSRVSMLEGRLLGARGRYEEAIEVIERALGESYSDSLAFARSSYIRWLITYSSRAGQLDRADSHLERWRQVNGSRDQGLYGTIALACAESELARHRGRTGDALVSAWTALQRSNHVRAHRFRLLACCALVESAVAAGDLDCVRPFFDEMQHWHSLQIGEQSCDAYRVEAVFHLALARRTEPQSRAAGIDAPETVCVEGHTESEELRLFSRAYRAAHAEARLLDRRFGGRHHVRELAQRVKEMC